MSPSGPKVYLGGGSWIVSGPVIAGAISGEVGAAGAGAGAAAAPGGAPAGGAAAGGGGAGGDGADGSWASWSAHAPDAPTPIRAQTKAAPEMVLFFILCIWTKPLDNPSTLG